MIIKTSKKFNIGYVLDGRLTGKTFCVCVGVRCSNPNIVEHYKELIDKGLKELLPNNIFLYEDGDPLGQDIAKLLDIEYPMVPYQRLDLPVTPANIASWLGEMLKVYIKNEYELVLDIQEVKVFDYKDDNFILMKEGEDYD